MHEHGAGDRDTTNVATRRIEPSIVLRYFLCKHAFAFAESSLSRFLCPFSFCLSPPLPGLVLRVPFRLLLNLLHAPEHDQSFHNLIA
jgi:hypothetical protein